jgi:transposase-like protein
MKRFVIGDTAKKASKEARVSRKCANLYFNHFRESIADAYNRAPVFDGNVEVDICFFGKSWKRKNHERKVKLNRIASGLEEEKDILEVEESEENIVKKIINIKAKIKDDEGESIKVLGIQKRDGNVYTQIIEKKDEDNLLPIVRAVIQKGATVFSDFEPALRNLTRYGYVHKRVNKSIRLVGREGENVGMIESFCGHCGRLHGRFMSVRHRTFYLHLKEWEFRWNNREAITKDNQKAMLKTLKDILKDTVFYKNPSKPIIKNNKKDINKTHKRRPLNVR